MKLVAIQLANLKYRLPYKESHMRKLTHAEYVRKVQGIHKGNIEIISKFDGTRNPVKYRCNVCGFIGEKHANNLIHTKPQGCVRCGVSSRPQCQPMSAAEIKRKMLKATNYKIIGGEVTDGGRDYVLVQCKVCKRQCEVRPFLYRNSGDNHYGDSCCKGEASAKNSSKQASKLKVIKLAGKIHKVRGYEPYAIAYILKHKKIPATDIAIRVCLNINDIIILSLNGSLYDLCLATMIHIAAEKNDTIRNSTLIFQDTNKSLMPLKTKQIITETHVELLIRYAASRHLPQ
jgi:hypothetical protein